MLQTLERQGKRLSRLITDLLFLSRLEQSTQVTDFQPCCLNDLISDLTEEFLELALQGGITLESQLPPTALYVPGDESQLYRLVANLIANALQYTPPGGLVQVGLTLKDGKALITVKDTGVGIDPAEQKKIFQRFYRSDGARSRKTGGAGLGLALAQAIAHHHGGALAVTSALGTGSAFTVSLPLGALNGRAFLRKD
jgi:two-component Ni(II)/redox sensor kinase NrsS